MRIAFPSAAPAHHKAAHHRKLAADPHGRDKNAHNTMATLPRLNPGLMDLTERIGNRGSSLSEYGANSGAK
jgi:hypothetical protein